jgi:hypothetical protein
VFKNEIVEKFSDPNNEENHNVLNKTVQTTSNSCVPNINARNRLARSFSKYNVKERPTQTGVSLERNVLLYSPSIWSESEGMSISSISTFVNTFKKGGSVSLCNEELMDDGGC